MKVTRADLNIIVPSCIEDLDAARNLVADLQSDLVEMYKQRDLNEFLGKLVNTEPEIETWYFTFGSGHAHPNGYVKIPGTFEVAREEMFRRYGGKWCMQYTKEKALPIIEAYNMQEVK